MKKGAVIIISLLLLMIPGIANAFDSEGEVIFRDALYGAAIGALLGVAFYVADDDDFGEKVAVGVIVGTVGGLAYGLYETKSFVEIKKDEVKFAVPTPVLQRKDSDLQVSASLFRSNF